MHNKYLYLIILLLLLIVSGCEKDHTVAPPVIDIDKGAELLCLLEAKGDYVNNNLIPLIDADWLYLHRDDYIVFDVRSSDDYSMGHIEGAINIQSSVLIDSVENVNLAKQIVLVSRTGEASAYYTSLLRAIGFSNVYTLNFGMGSWNSFFANVWLDRILNYPGFSIFSTEKKEKKIAYNLPNPDLQEGNTLEDKLRLKIKRLLTQGFTEETGAAAPVASVEFKNVIEELNNYYIVCAGPEIFYYSKLYGTYHLLGSAKYLIPPDLSDFRSVSYLQSLPDKGKILLYSGSGQESAFFTAYLRLLGYDAVSILLGCNSFSYSMLSVRDDLLVYQFNNSVIRNYPYIH